MRDHKSLLAWQEARAVVLVLLPAIRQVKYSYANPVFSQLQRAALSVQLNIAEGYALRASKRFRNHLDIAYASAVETAELLELSGEIASFQPIGSARLSSGAADAKACFWASSGACGRADAAHRSCPDPSSLVSPLPSFPPIFLPLTSYLLPLTSHLSPSHLLHFPPMTSPTP